MWWSSFANALTGSIRFRVSSDFSKPLSGFQYPVDINNSSWPVHTYLLNSFEKIRIGVAVYFKKLVGENIFAQKTLQYREKTQNLQQKHGVIHT